MDTYALLVESENRHDRPHFYLPQWSYRQIELRITRPIDRVARRCDHGDTDLECFCGLFELANLESSVVSSS